MSTTGARQDALTSESDPELERRLFPDKILPNPTNSLTVSTTGTSASAAFARSLFLFLGLMFRRPSKLFRPSRVDTWAGLRQLALSADQTLSPTFIRNLLKRKSGFIALTLTLLPPLVINTSLGFLLFTSHSVFALSLARLPFFQHKHSSSSNLPRYGNTEAENTSLQQDEPINLHTLMSGPSIIPRHPTLLSGVAGAGAGLVQGLAFTPIENVVRLLHDSASSLTSLLARFLRLPMPVQAPMTAQPLPSSPVQAMKNFLSSDTWRKSPSWWTGWRWTVARDSVSYGVFFAAFDVTRRVGLRVKALFGGSVSRDWDNFVSIEFGGSSTSVSESASSRQLYKGDDPLPPSETPTKARVAQAVTIVTGGVTASILAEVAGRPFRVCQKIMMERKSSQVSTGHLGRSTHPILELYKARGLRPFFHREGVQMISATALDATGTESHFSTEATSVGRSPGRGTGARVRRAAMRFGWRLAAVGPWGLGFLVWAWVGGEV